MALTAKKRLFAEAVLRGKSNRDAAIEAGYSAATASAAGSRLVKDPAVVAFLREKKKEPETVPASAPDSPPFDIKQALQHSDPKAFLLAAMNDTQMDKKLRVDAAKALMPFMHQKKGEGGKKDANAEAAQKAASRFPAAAPPRLAALGGRKV